MSSFLSSLTAQSDIFTKTVQQTFDQQAAFNEYKSVLPKDSFDTVFADQIRRFSRGEDRIKNAVGKRNRQYRGTSPKAENIASLRVIANVSADSREIPQSQQQAGGFVIFGTDQFVLQNSQESDVERYQIVETFGEPVAFFFGRRPRIYSYSGFLYNSGSRFPQEDSSVNSMLWRDNFKLAYELFLRGTKCVQFRARAYLNYDLVLREGFILNNQIQQTIEPNMVSFSFSMFVTREINLDSVFALAKNTLEGQAAGAKPSDATVNAIRQSIRSGNDIERTLDTNVVSEREQQAIAALAAAQG